MSARTMKPDLPPMAQGPMAAGTSGGGERGRIAALLDQGRIDAALRAIESLVEEVFCEPLNTAEIFGDAFLDAACQRAGAMSLASSGAVHAGPGERVPLVFIASRLDPSGGHTAVLADIARLAGMPARILLTGVAGSTDPARLAHRFGRMPDLAFEHAPRGSRLARLQWLQGRLRELRPQVVWLVNHHQDSVAVAAVQPRQGYALKYLHHGDHHLCLGVHLPFGEHYDPHAMGWHNCREVLGKSDNRYLPMAVAPPSATAAPVQRSGPLVTCTAAGHNKIEHDYWPAYADVVAALLARTGGGHVHIGRLSLMYRWRIRRALAREGVAPQAFRFIPHVPNLAEALLRERVDLYLSSFPYPGARTLVEAMAAGVPVALHDHASSRFLGALDMAPEGACVWSRPEELLGFVASVDRAALGRLGAQARRHYDRHHAPGLMAAALAPGAAPLEAPPARFPHRDDVLAQAVYRARQFSLVGLLRRRALRAARFLKSRLS
ncbi:MAG TPA: hypothetical protein VFM98_00425 [Ramlibacter sp.]|uniref:glycosyltransferase n=1 Tax=Ramlibacter sp. TaxID=1917967 RepID=UPI002D8108E0|nr:hypothetical protein [Ramlibacter sp.]HET8744040.1 hypothetical protein [Ramlibacter sp.]